MNTAFEKLLDSLFREMSIDVSSDISVLHTVLAQEGLVDGPFERGARVDMQPNRLDSTCGNEIGLQCRGLIGNGDESAS